jgi:hypothetical protein
MKKKKKLGVEGQPHFAIETMKKKIKVDNMRA